MIEDEFFFPFYLGRCYVRFGDGPSIHCLACIICDIWITSSCNNRWGKLAQLLCFITPLITLVDYQSKVWFFALDIFRVLCRMCNFVNINFSASGFIPWPLVFFISAVSIMMCFHCFKLISVTYDISLAVLQIPTSYISGVWHCRFAPILSGLFGSSSVWFQRTTYICNPQCHNWFCSQVFFTHICFLLPDCFSPYSSKFIYLSMMSMICTNVHSSVLQI